MFLRNIKRNSVKFISQMLIEIKQSNSTGQSKHLQGALGKQSTLDLAMITEAFLVQILRDTIDLK
jgi:hypothetical protein